MDKGSRNREVPPAEGERESHLFLVRLWAAGEVEDRYRWHGKVQHVTKGRSHTFNNWAMLVDFLAEMLPQGESGASDGTEISGEKRGSHDY